MTNAYRVQADAPSPPQQPSAKKKLPYTKPVLTVYGSVRQMTGGPSTGDRGDGQGMNFMIIGE
jgi:hypothetical protein